ncbi:MAG: F0F1 ATP synthase subunit A [Deltaproteobacteria bacterium]|nr:F0F1 ATP synthase subunit A [Deltaproteobacteria bacterium]
MEAHYNYLQHVIGPSVPHADEWQKFVTAVLLALGLIAISKIATSRLRANGAVSEVAVKNALVPDAKMNLFGFFDYFIEAFVKFHDSVLGHQGRKYLPFTGTLFIFILASNFIGLIPGVPALTTTVWVNVGLAIVVFIFFNTLGVKEHGVIGYLKHFAQPLFLAPFLFPLEIFSTVLRVLTLNLRLYWNISADHLVLGIFTGMLGPILPVPLYILGTFVCFMQAFIFTTLTMVYILLATQHEEEH